MILVVAIFQPDRVLDERPHVGPQDRAGNDAFASNTRTDPNGTVCFLMRCLDDGALLPPIVRRTNGNSYATNAIRRWRRREHGGSEAIGCIQRGDRTASPAEDDLFGADRAEEHWKLLRLK